MDKYKYCIEDNIDFFEELNKNINHQTIHDTNNKCLITNQELTSNHIKLNCGHAFNYIPLYYDILNHKQKFNILESYNSKLNMNEIRCPYCRVKHKYILPYYEELGLLKVNGVNHSVYECIYTFTKGKQKRTLCGKKTVNNQVCLCKLHL